MGNAEGTNVLPKQLIEKRYRDKKDEPTPLAFTIDDAVPKMEYSVSVVTWSAAALSCLKQLDTVLRQQKPRISVPIVGLRGRIELVDPLTLRVDRNVGLSYFGTIAWTHTTPQECTESFNETVLGWLTDDVADAAKCEPAQQIIEDLKRLARTQSAVEAVPRVARPFDWNTGLSKTAKPALSTTYADLADFVARELEGKNVFPELPPLRRIAGGQLEQNQAELITEPFVFGTRERFSIVVRIRVFSYPGRPKPIVSVEFSRRVWTTGLKQKFGAQTVSAYALPDGSSRAFSFTLRQEKAEANTWVYKPEGDFGPIERKFFTGKPLTTDYILKQGHRLPKCKLLVSLKHGTGERSEAKSGVPDLDKMEGYRGIEEILKPIGLLPWSGLSKVESTARPAKDRDQHWSKRDSDSEPDQKKYIKWLADARESLSDSYSGKHHIIIAVQPGYDVDADAVFVEGRLKDILQGSVLTTRVPISPLVHGPRKTLPGKEFSNPAERAATRVAEWQTFIESVKRWELDTEQKVNGVLVIAHEWYPGNSHDDSVNKRAARIAIAEGLGVPVQYLLPRAQLTDESKATEPESGEFSCEQKIDKGFENRLMIAWLDLAFKSLGRVKTAKVIKEGVNLYDTSNLFEAYPDKILALGVIRRNKSRFRANERSFLPYAIELDVEQGVCSASFAYEDPATKNLTFPDPLPLPQALVKLAVLGPVELTSEQKDRKKHLEERTQAFFKHVLASFGRRSMRPLVLIDADSSKTVWPWLKDDVIDPQNVHLAGGYNAQVAWRHASLVRVRTDNSPKVLWDGEYHGVITGTDKEVRYWAPDWAEAELFRITDTIKTNLYLSFGSSIRTGRTKGKSCYHEVEGMKAIGRTGKFEAAIMKRHTDAWTTPIGVELFVVRTGERYAQRACKSFPSLVRL